MNSYILMIVLILQMRIFEHRILDDEIIEFSE